MTTLTANVEKFCVFWCRQTPALHSIVLICISTVAFSILLALWVWQPFRLHTLRWMVQIGLFGTIPQTLLSQALKETDPTALMPFDFHKLIWIALIGAWFFAKIPDISTWIGASVIFASGLFNAFREHRANTAT